MMTQWHVNDYDDTRLLLKPLNHTKNDKGWYKFFLNSRGRLEVGSGNELPFLHRKGSLPGDSTLTLLILIQYSQHLKKENIQVC